jgi:hypothetical protein
MLAIIFVILSNISFSSAEIIDNNRLQALDERLIISEIEIVNRAISVLGPLDGIESVKSQINNSIYIILKNYLLSLHGDDPDVSILNEYALYMQIHPLILPNGNQINDFDELDSDLMASFFSSNIFNEIDPLVQSYYEYYYYSNIIQEFPNNNIIREYHDLSQIVAYIDSISRLAPFDDLIRDQYVDFLLSGQFLEEDFWNLRNREFDVLNAACSIGDNNCEEKIHEYIIGLGNSEINLLRKVACEGVIVLNQKFFLLNGCVNDGG